ncbi:MAG: redox-regulated ATPase YchF [Deltaproteobacteria bacterium]|nr:MAG: redox-regulated ATPase YchF [Deltaproteobacteria bacterium]PIE73315.1 MAG: redox-regulated ATPase YchF [Deltaproteobacteria bacterium]
MKIGIIGLPQAGKKNLFSLLTGNDLQEQTVAKPIPGVADIQDPRFDKLVSLYQPARQEHARINLLLLPKLEKENIARGDIFADIADADGLCLVVRAFVDDAIYHPDGSVNPLRDTLAVHSELIMHDQIFVEKRIERLEKSQKKQKTDKQEAELVLMRKFQTHLEKERPLRLLALSDEEETLILSYPFLTKKELLVVFNVSEDMLNTTKMLEEAADFCQEQKVEAMQVCTQVESEIALLDSEEERLAFMADLGIETPALTQMTRLCLKALGLISFFTVGKDEVRQWLVKKDATAPEAAGVIHSDLQRGFIRAEQMSYSDLLAAGGEAELKKEGKIYLQGKNYLVADGDILNIRFKV